MSQPNDWVDPDYDVSDLVGGNPSVGGPYSCRFLNYNRPCPACELNHAGKRVGRNRQRGCTADLQNHPDLVASLQTQLEESGGSSTTRKRKSRTAPDSYADESDMVVDDDDDDEETESPSKRRTTRSQTTVVDSPSEEQVEVQMVTQTKFNEERRKFWNLRRANRTLQEQLETEKEKNKALTTELKSTKTELRKAKARDNEQKDMVAKFKQIPSFCKEGGNWPMHVWEHALECVALRGSVPVLRSLWRKFQVHFLPWLDETTFKIPSETSLNEYRAQSSVVCELLAAIQYARAPYLHVGLDATAIMTLKGNVDTMNCWAVLPAEDGTNGPKRAPELVTLGAVRPQGDGTAVGEAKGFEVMFEEGAKKVEHFNSLLTPSHRIENVGGGCTIAKVKSVMNDTSPQAIATQMKLRERILEMFEEMHTDEEWDELDAAEKVVVVGRCNHHLRNLLETESDRHSDQRLKEMLGDEAAEFDQQSRIELKFQSYAFALLKSFKRTSRDSYSKAGTAAIRFFFAKQENRIRFAGLMMFADLGRIVGSRQDCIFRTAAQTFSLWKALPAYWADGIIESGEEEGQILKTSLEVRGTCCYFIAEHWFHALAWHMLFEPLRMVMGTDEDDKDYLATAPLFDELYTLAERFQAEPDYLIRKLRDGVEFIFNDQWKTSKVGALMETRAKKPGYDVATQERIPGSNMQDTLRATLLDYYYDDAGWSEEGAGEIEKQQNAADAIVYMHRCMSDLGKAMIISLERSCYPLLAKMVGVKCNKQCNQCDHCLMNGVYSIGKQTAAMKIHSSLRVTHNNYAETPFAIAKELRRLFPTMNLATIEGLVLACQNKTLVRSETITKKKASKFRKEGAFSGFYHTLNEKQKLAVREVAKDEKYNKEKKFRLDRHWIQHEERMEVKRKAKRVKIDNRVQKAIDAFALGRVEKKTVLKSELKKCWKLDNKGKVVKVANKIQYQVGMRTRLLEGQVRYRLVGCSWKYDFDASLLTNVKTNRLDKLEQLLIRMMAVENTAAGKVKYKTLAQAEVSGVYKFNVPVLGRKTRIRSDIEEQLRLKTESLVEKVDDDELLELESEFVGETFFDDGLNANNVKECPEETRVVVAVEYDPPTEKWQVLSHVVNRDGSAKPPTAQKRAEYYIIGDNLRQMIEMHDDNLPMMK